MQKTPVRDPPPPRPGATHAALSPAPHYGCNAEFCITPTTSNSPAAPHHSSPLFADDAIARLHRAANGLPRQINNAATAALIAAGSASKDLVDDSAAKKAAAELTRD